MDRTQVIKLFLNYGANPNIPDNYGETMLMSVIRLDNTELVQLALDHGADPNMQNINGETALMLASMNGHIQIVQLLLDNNADKDNRYRARMVAKNEDTRYLIDKYLGESILQCEYKSKEYMSVVYQDIIFV